MAMRFPPAVQSVIDTYDPATGCYRKPDGGLDACHTEVETLALWKNLIQCLKPVTVVETGVYYGLSTCYIAAALAETGTPGACVHSIDPWVLPHLWRGTELESMIKYYPLTSQDAAPLIADLTIDLLLIDSIHTYAQSSWELATFEPQLRAGGYIIMHDSIFFDGVGRTAQHLYDSPRFEVMTFDTPRTAHAATVSSGPISMGCTVARKICGGDPIQRDPAWLDIPEGIPAGPEAFIRRHVLEVAAA